LANGEIIIGGMDGSGKLEFSPKSLGQEVANTVVVMIRISEERTLEDFQNGFHEIRKEFGMKQNKEFHAHQMTESMMIAVLNDHAG
jgi:hypothetical protein